MALSERVKSTVSCADPDREQMISVLNLYTFIYECDEGDIEEALYWFSHDWHSGQFSNLYAVLSTSPFSPSRLAEGPSEDGFAMELYEELEAAFVTHSNG